MGGLPDLFNLTGRVAVVTGGAGFLGAEFCMTLAEAGAGVVVADINRDPAVQLAETLNSKHQHAGSTPRAVPVQVDISSQSSVQELFTATIEQFGHVDILVNAAAIDPKFDPASLGDPGSPQASGEHDHPMSIRFEDYPLELWQQAMDVNLTGVFLCCQAAGNLMVYHGGGVIINISSIYGLVGPDQRIYQSPGSPERFKPVYYSTTKAGVLGLTRYLAAYYAGKNIRVNALTPGGVYHEHDEDFIKAYSSRTLLGRMAEKDELNGALLFLASDASKYMTGGNLVIDGGWTAW